jgi:hypothetical protein
MSGSIRRPCNPIGVVALKRNPNAVINGPIDHPRWQIKAAEERLHPSSEGSYPRFHCIHNRFMGHREASRDGIWQRGL